MIDKKAFVERRQVIRYVQDGVFLSDLTLTALILTLLKNEANCFQAVPDENNKSRFLFFIKGNPEVIKKTITEFYSAGINKPMDGLKEFIAKQTYLKSLLDKAKMGGMNG